MLERNALGISRGLGLAWFVVAALASLIAIWNLPLLVWWPLGLAVLGILTGWISNAQPAAVLLGSVFATLFALWVASTSDAGTDYFSLLLAAMSIALGMASASALNMQRRAHVTLRDAD